MQNNLDENNNQKKILVKITQKSCSGCAAVRLALGPPSMTPGVFLGGQSPVGTSGGFWQ